MSENNQSPSLLAENLIYGIKDVGEQAISGDYPGLNCHKAEYPDGAMIYTLYSVESSEHDRVLRAGFTPDGDIFAEHGWVSTRNSKFSDEIVIGMRLSERSGECESYTVRRLKDANGYPFKVLIRREQAEDGLKAISLGHKYFYTIVASELINLSNLETRESENLEDKVVEAAARIAELFAIYSVNTINDVQAIPMSDHEIDLEGYSLTRLNDREGLSAFVGEDGINLLAVFSNLLSNGLRRVDTYEIRSGQDGLEAFLIRRLYDIDNNPITKKDPISLHPQNALEAINAQIEKFRLYSESYTGSH